MGMKEKKAFLFGFTKRVHGGRKKKKIHYTKMRWEFLRINLVLMKKCSSLNKKIAFEFEKQQIEHNLYLLTSKYSLRWEILTKYQV